MVDAYATQAGLQLAIQTGCNLLEAKSDCIEVIQYCSGENQMRKDATAIYADCLGSTSIIGKVEFKYRQER